MHDLTPETRLTFVEAPVPAPFVGEKVLIRFFDGNVVTMEIRENTLFDHEDRVAFDLPEGGLLPGVRYDIGEMACLVPYEAGDFWLERAI